MGSVKDLEISIQPTADKEGNGFFKFKDTYSVFDWGAMPDLIENKSQALALMGAKTFVEADEAEIPNIYKGLEGARGLMQYELSQLHAQPSNKMFVVLANRVSIENDYANYSKEGLDNYVVPLEVITRRGLPHGSSVFKRIKKLKAKEDDQGLAKLIRDLGLTSEPKEGDMLPKPKTGFTTKFEPEDRKVSNEEAQRISGLSQEQFDTLVNLQERVDDVINKTAEKAGMQYWDGKREYVVIGGEILLADVAGTFDEDRMTKSNIALSKQPLREANKELNADWYRQVEAAKERASEENIKEWKQFVKVNPDKLPPNFINLVRTMYLSGSNAYAQIKFFDVPPLEEVIDQIKDSTYLDYFKVKKVA